MQKGRTLEFTCQRCKNKIAFSLFELTGHRNIVECEQCQKKYSFDDPTLVRQLKLFEDLCRQIRESEEILSSASVGIDVDGRNVLVPYKLLLTRLSSSLDLTIGDESVAITFRIEPAEDLTNLSI